MTAPALQTAAVVALLLGGVTGALGSGAAGLGGAGDEDVLELHCRLDRQDHAAMESHYAEQFCWAHLGAHHYFPGRDVLYALKAGTGVVLSVEQQLSPPVETGELHPVPPQVNSSLAIETSLDGIAWEPVAGIEYRLYRVLPFTLLQDLRQEIHFAFSLEDEQPFRYLRVRQPLSAMQGLSGFLDHSEVRLDVRTLAWVPPVDLVPAAGVNRSCASDVMEAFFTLHACTYGGLNRYDAPSFFHTYPLGHARLDEVRVEATAAYWRPEDPGLAHGQTLAGMASGDLLLLASQDGELWWELGRAPIVYGLPATAVFPLDDLEVAFLRLATDKHPGYWNHPALKHPEGYLVHSALELTGLLPAAS